MEKSSVFQFKSYKSWLESLLNNPSNRGLMSQISRQIDCQRSYLSRVLNTKLQLTPDYAYKISQALHLSGEEQEYFLLLVDWDRCQDPGLRQHLSARLQKMKSGYSEVRQKIQRPQSTQSIDEIQFFSAWYWAAIHLWCSSPGSHTIESVARKFSLDLATAGRVLDSLAEAQFLEKMGRGYKYKTGAMHIDRKSPLAHWNHANWRQKALQDAQSGVETGLHFTNLQTMTRTDFLKIRQLMLELIEKSERIARPSAPEELVAICLDAFILE
jgi:uncharacterized protein (TIGR02147 family)